MGSFYGAQGALNDVAEWLGFAGRMEYLSACSGNPAGVMRRIARRVA